MISVDSGTSSFDVFVDCFGEMYKLRGTVHLAVPGSLVATIYALNTLTRGLVENGYDGQINCRQKQTEGGDQWTYELYWSNSEKEMPKDLMEGLLAGCKDCQITSEDRSATAVTSAPFLFSRGTQVTIKKAVLARKHLKARFRGKKVDVKMGD